MEKNNDLIKDVEMVKNPKEYKNPDVIERKTIYTFSKSLEELDLDNILFKYSDAKRNTFVISLREILEDYGF